MFKKIHLLFVFAFALPAASYARGPWDNGDYSQFFDESGIYQTAMYFKNGSGFSQWGTNVALADNATAGGVGAVTASLKIGSPIDRSVIYYKGIVFVGNAVGMVDHVRNSVIGITNSFANFSSTAAAAGAGGGAVTATSVIVNNGPVNLTANTVFNATINQNAPILKFNGTGQLSIVDAAAAPLPTTTTTTTITTNSNPAVTVPPTPNTVTTSTTTTSTPAATTTTATSIAALSAVNTEIVTMHVVGSRIFQSSTR